MDEWQEEEEVQVDLSDLNIKELPQPEEERDSAGQVLDADGNPTAPQPAVWNRNKDKGKRQHGSQAYSHYHVSGRRGGGHTVVPLNVLWNISET